MLPVRWILLMGELHHYWFYRTKLLVDQSKVFAKRYSLWYKWKEATMTSGMLWGSAIDENFQKSSRSNEHFSFRKLWSDIISMTFNAKMFKTWQVSMLTFFQNNIAYLIFKDFLIQTLYQKLVLLANVTLLTSKEGLIFEHEGRLICFWCFLSLLTEVGLF